MTSDDFSWDPTHEIMKKISQVRKDFVKMIYEGALGEDLGETKSNIGYKNYIVDMGEIRVGASTNLGANKLTITSEQAKANARTVVSLLMTKLKLTKAQACGIAGVMMAESGMNPGAYNKLEKAGKYKNSSANGAGYGAGLVQWSNARKQSALKLIGSRGPIESLGIEQQVDMLCLELVGTYKATLEGIRKSTTADQSAATFYCHSIAGFSTSREPASKQEIDKCNARYKTVGANSQINKGMGYALGFMESI